MITLIGVGHVFAISDQVKNLIRTKRPQVVCIELDPARFKALKGAGLHEERAAAVQASFHIFQTRMAGKFGTERETEMPAAGERCGE